MCHLTRKPKPKNFCWKIVFHNLMKKPTCRYTEKVCLGYNGETTVLEMRRIWSTLSLPLLLDPLWPGVVVPAMIHSMCPIHLFANYHCLITQVNLDWAVSALLHVKPDTWRNKRKTSPEDPTVVKAAAASVVGAPRAGCGTQRSPGHPLQPGSLLS